MRDSFLDYTLDFETPVQEPLQQELEQIDAGLRGRFGMTADQTAIGLLDLRQRRLAMIRPDQCEYAASLPKIAILLAWFARNPEVGALSETVRHELGLMIKASDNEMASKYSRRLGLKEIQQALDGHGFYDVRRGGGIWMGKHYGRGGERYGDPLNDHSHAATVRQLLRFFLLLEQRRLISEHASDRMREIFLSPAIPHDDIKFVKGLKGRDVQIMRKWGSWQDWLHDAAVIKGEGRHYILVALTHHPRGDDYLVELARQVHELLR